MQVNRLGVVQNPRQVAVVDDRVLSHVQILQSESDQINFIVQARQMKHSELNCGLHSARVLKLFRELLLKRKPKAMHFQYTLKPICDGYNS